MATHRILAFAGSTRKGSFNQKALEIAVAGAIQAGGEVTLISLADYPLPLMNQDLEEADGLPFEAKRLKKLFMEHDGLLIASPEYNSSITPLLKNTLDWVSRPVAGQEYLGEFKGKVAGLVSASPGGLGGLRALFHVRDILLNIGITVLPNHVSIPNAADAFADDGSLKDKKKQASVESVGADLARAMKKL
jgi:NAD(P)H-dependent FMN reductase